MQILKDEVRNEIIQAGAHTFFDMGYQKASMRVIAQKAGVTVGNVYRYFENKEALFDAIVKPAYEKVEMLVKFDHVLPDVDFERFQENLTTRIMELYDEYALELQIVLCSSEGTKYYNVIEQIKVMLVNHVYETKKEKINCPLSEKDIIYAISLTTGSFIDTFIKLMDEKKEREEFYKWIRISTSIYFRDIQKRIMKA